MYCVDCGKKVLKGKSFCHHCGSPIPAVPRRRPSIGGPAEPRRKRTLAVGIVTFCVILLLGGVLAVYVVMGEGTPRASAPRSVLETQSPTSVVELSSTVSSAATTTALPTTTTALPTTTTAIPTTTTTMQSTNTTLDLGLYISAVNTVVHTLTACDQRIPEIGEVIGVSAPFVPVEVVDELGRMEDELRSQRSDLGRVGTPVGYEDSHVWLDLAVQHMIERVQYALQGVEAIHDTGRPSAAEASFAKAREARDDFRQAFDMYRQIVAMR